MKFINKKLILISAVLLQFSTGAMAEVETSGEVINKAISKKSLKKLNINSYSDVVRESDFSNYAATQKILLPKSNRIQLKLGLSTLTNDVYYNGLGFNIGALYHFNETWGVGLSGYYLSSSQKSQTKNIQDIQGVSVDVLSTIKQTSNASLYFTPIYGKWSFAEDKILSFDIYFSAGAAQVTDQFNKSVAGTSAGFGQLISLSESSVIDVNFQWLFYKSQDINKLERQADSMLLTVGYGFFWPQAGNKISNGRIVGE